MLTQHKGSTTTKDFGCPARHHESFDRHLGLLIAALIMIAGLASVLLQVQKEDSVKTQIEMRCIQAGGSWTTIRTRTHNFWSLCTLLAIYSGEQVSHIVRPGGGAKGGLYFSWCELSFLWLLWCRGWVPRRRSLRVDQWIQYLQMQYLHVKRRKICIWCLHKDVTKKKENRHRTETNSFNTSLCSILRQTDKRNIQTVSIYHVETIDHIKHLRTVQRNRYMMWLVKLTNANTFTPYKRGTSRI